MACILQTQNNRILENPDKNNAKTKRSLFGRILRFFGFLVLGFLALLITLTIFLAFPPVQTWIAQRAAAYFSDKLGITVTIDRVSINLISGNVALRELRVLDHHSDTLLLAGKLETRPDLINLSQPEIVLGETRLSDALFRLHKYPGEDGMNLDYIIRQFRSDQSKDTTGKPVGFKIKKILLENVAFNLLDETADTLPAAFQPGNIRALVSRGEMQDFRIAKDSIIFKVRELKALEQSGSGLQHFETDFVICSTAMLFNNSLLETVQGSFVKGDIGFHYENWTSFSEFVDSVRFDTRIDKSSVKVKDIAFYTDALKNIPLTIRFQGQVKGPVSDMKGRNLELSFGEESFMAMNADVFGLPEIDETLFDIKIKGLDISPKDLSRLKINPDGTGLNIPEEIIRLGKVRYVGRITGSLGNFVTEGIFHSAAGSIATDLQLTTERGFKNPSYRGKIKTVLFDPGILIGDTKTLGPISGEAEMEGKGFDPENMELTLRGDFSKITLLGYPYSGITIKRGYLKNKAFSGNLQINDPNLKLRFEGTTDFSGRIPHFHFKAAMKSADLHALGLYPDTLTINNLVSDIDFTGKSIDNIMGSLVLDSLVFSTARKTHDIGKITLTADSFNTERRLVLSGAPANAELSGDFQLIPLVHNLKFNLNEYFPSFRIPYDKKLASQSQRLDFDIKVNNLNPIFDVFSPQLFVSGGTRLSGKYFSELRTSEVILESESIGFGKLKAADLELFLSTSEKEVDMTLNISRFFVDDSVWFDYVDANAAAFKDSLQAAISWKDDVFKLSRGNIQFVTWLGVPGCYDLYFDHTSVFLKNTEWKLKKGAFLGYSRNALEAYDFSFSSSEGGYLTINGLTDEKRENSLDLVIKDFPLEFFRSLGKNMPQMSGSLSGKAGIYALFDQPFISADLKIDRFTLFDQLFGDFSFISQFIPAEQALKVDGRLNTPAGISLEFTDGRIYPFSKTQNLDLTLGFSRFNIKPAETFTAPILTKLNGYLTGNLRVRGLFEAPILEGSAYIEEGHVEIPYIGGVYNLQFKPAKKIRVSRYHIDFGEIILEDQNYRKASLRGNIRHRDFKDLELYLEVSGEDFLFFNASKEQSPIFYGSAVATGTAVIKGPFDRLDVNASVKSEKGTRLFIPMESGPSTASENSFVVFRDSRDTAKKGILETKPREQAAGIQLNVDAEINENAEVQIIFDEFSGDVLRSAGRGNLRVELSRQGDLTMFGDYEVIKGDYLFTLKNLVNKKLKLIQGGAIYWTGDPSNAKIDAAASYSLRTSAFPLLAGSAAGISESELEQFKSRIPVDVIVKLSGNLLEPQIAFDIRFPSVDERTRAQLMQALATEDEKNKQAFALLVLRQFINSGTGAGDAANVAGGNTLEVLSNQLSNWVSQLSEGLDVGVRYRNKDNTTSGQDEVELALSTRLFNDRVNIDGNFGVATTKSTSTTPYNNLIDVNVEVKITEDGKLRIRGFNRSNEANIIQAFPYTQGVGVSYQTTFDAWKDLVKRKKKRSAKPSPAQKKDTD